MAAAGTLFLVVAGLALAPAARAEPDPGPGRRFVNFESGPVRPVALSADGSRLFVTNTPDDRLEIFDLVDGGLVPAGSVRVGLEPVAVAVHGDEAWVVNHLSDSISIVDVSTADVRVVRTLFVGDEPRDIVFGGSGGGRAFVTTAHRGQNHPLDPQLTTPGVGRADVWVFDSGNLGTSLGGDPLTIVTLFGDTPRALTVSPDGKTVFAAIFHSGNRTTSVHETLVPDGFEAAGPTNVFGTQVPGGLPGPSTNHEGIAAPETGLIVKFDPRAGGAWRDVSGRDWSDAVRFSLPDLDVFALDADANPPVTTRSFASVGTILFDMIVNPANGKVYVTNTEANNLTRFEGTGIFGGSTVRSNLHRARITVVDPAGSVVPHELNTHIDYDRVPSPAKIAKRSLSTPLGMAIAADGSTLYVAAFGSGVVGVVDTAALEAGEHDPSSAAQVPLSAGGPSGLVLDESRSRLYVATRFDNGVSVVDTGTGREVQHVRMHSAEPRHVVRGRPFLYDARLTSSNGEASCSACHVFGDFDSLAWDLGDPDGDFAINRNPLRADAPIPGLAQKNFHPMKGPMTTQSLRGMANAGPMHWRGDRTGSAVVGGDPLDEDAAFRAFNVAFPGLVGRKRQLTDQQMRDFSSFALSIAYPPNPVRRLDDSLTDEQLRGRTRYFGGLSDGIGNCNFCHAVDANEGFFGTDGFSTFEAEPQFFKVAHLRNLYQKVGMFGMPANPFFNPGDNGFKGDQVRGFGFSHDGSVDTVARFVEAVLFNFGFGGPAGFQNVTQRREMEAFLLAFDTDLKPIVGQQVTLTSANGVDAGPRINLLISRAQVGDCDLVVHGRIAGEPRGWVFGAGQFQSDRTGAPPLFDSELRALAATPGQELTYTAVPPDTGVRCGVDRDTDGSVDADERDAGSDDADVASLPAKALICAGDTVLLRPRLRVKAHRRPEKDLALKLTCIVPDVGPVDPVDRGFAFKLTDGDGDLVLMAVIPGGAPVVPGGPGWSVSRNGRVVTFDDPEGSVAHGIRRVRLKTPPAGSSGQVGVSVIGRAEGFAGEGITLPVTLEVILGGPDDAAAGRCATAVFGPQDGPRPRCTIGARGSRIDCR